MLGTLNTVFFYAVYFMICQSCFLCFSTSGFSKTNLKSPGWMAQLILLQILFIRPNSAQSWLRVSLCGLRQLCQNPGSLHFLEKNAALCSQFPFMAVMCGGAGG